jgi:hypothetical protein
LPTIRPEFCFSLPTAPFLNPNISDAEARLASARLHHAGVGSQIRNFARMDAMAYDKTVKSERFSVENLEAGCIILARPTAP